MQRQLALHDADLPIATGVDIHDPRTGLITKLALRDNLEFECTFRCLLAVRVDSGKEFGVGAIGGVQIFTAKNWNSGPS